MSNRPGSDRSRWHRSGTSENTNSCSSGLLEASRVQTKEIIDAYGILEQVESALPRSDPSEDIPKTLLWARGPSGHSEPS